MNNRAKCSREKQKRYAVVISTHMYMYLHAILNHIICVYMSERGGREKREERGEF